MFFLNKRLLLKIYGLQTSLTFLGMHINVGKDLFYETQSHSIEHIQNGKRQQHHKHSVQYIGLGEGFLFFRRPLTNSQYNHIPESKNRNMHPAKSLKRSTDPAPFLKFLDLFFLFIRFLHLFRRLALQLSPYIRYALQKRLSPYHFPVVSVLLWLHLSLCLCFSLQRNRYDLLPSWTFPATDPDR